MLLAVGDPHTRKVAGGTLRTRGFSVAATTESDAALTLAKSFTPDVMMIDFGLADPEGGVLFDTMRRLSDAFVIALTADRDKIRALRSGADDAVAATAGCEELAARCEALLRRPRRLNRSWDPLQALVIQIGPISIDVGRQEIRVHGHEVPVTRLEFCLFEQLCRQPAQICTRAALVERVWGPNWGADTHVIDVHLSNLRRKLEQVDPDLTFIHTVRSVGFRIGHDVLTYPSQQHAAVV